MIDASRKGAIAAVNTALIDLYWAIGKHISERILSEGWGKGTVEDLAEYIRRRQPNARGFSARNMWQNAPILRYYIQESDKTVTAVERICPGLTI